MATAPVKNPSFPGPPKFATVEEERRHRKERLAASFRLFSKFGFDEGVTGHITARDPEQPDHFWVNPFGVHFSQIRVSDLMLVNAKGEVVDEAVWWFITMDRRCQAQLLAEAAGKPISIDRENALLTRGQVGTHGAGWFQFQPLWQRITREQPDLFD